MTSIKNRLIALLLGLLVSLRAWSLDTFVIGDIRVDGLERISVGTVLNYVPVNIGDTFEESRAAEIIRGLFNTGFFDDIRLAVDDDALVITVRERPTIASIEISGNKDIKTDQLMEALRSIGLAEGRVFDRSSLERMKIELERQYFSQGKYGVSVDSTITELENNRVDVAIDIEEGDIARILQISIVGNRAYSSRELLGKFQLSPPRMFGFFSDDDQYSRRKLSGDLESLRSHYLDNGYINFAIDSTQVSISPDKKDVHVTVNVIEGEQYTVSEIRLSGDLIVPEEELRALIELDPGDIFSRRLVQQSATAISDRLGLEGYAFSNVSPSPRTDPETREVALTFIVDPGRRIYVRRINVAGNIKTEDEVVRREIRQMEGGWISTEKVNRSRMRLMRLGFFEEANVETPAVPGVADQVDVNFSVTERPSGTLMAGIGYSQSQGVLVNASVSQDNIFGTGKRVSATVNNSTFQRIFSFSYTNPYYTLNGVSRGLSLFSRRTDAGALQIADFSTDVHGFSVDYGIPISEFNTASIAVGYEKTRLNTNVNTPQEFLDFIAENSDRFDIYKVRTGVSRDTRNRAILADRGMLHSVSTEIALPGSGLEYYKLRYRGLGYIPLIAQLTLLLKGELGYGDGYGDTTELPFFENFYAGGPDSVRGYRASTLGPRAVNRPLGGSFKTTGNIELIFPVPFAADNKSLRLSTFFDIGNVFDGVGDFDSGELRSSVGLSVIWYTPIAPMTFSLARPLNDKPGDSTESFQFTLGSFFF
jgi:outer membrane protein insertion porin family